MRFGKIKKFFIDIDKGKTFLRKRDIPANSLVNILDYKLCINSGGGFHKWFGYLKEAPVDDEKFSRKLIGEYFVQPRDGKYDPNKGIWKPGKSKSLKFEILF